VEKRDSSKRPDSWKAIAAHLGRDVRTVQRWEKTLGLPIHRRRLEKLDSVYAFGDELDQWWGDGGGHRPEEHQEQTPKPGRRRRLLAVLPLRNQTGAVEQEYFSDGLTEELIGQLSQVNPERLGVIGFRSVVSFKHTNKPLNQISRDLGADYILDGSVRRSQDRIRIDVSLIDGDELIMRESYDRNMSDILELQSEVAREVTNRITVTITAHDPSQPAMVLAPDAYETYLRGGDLWNKRGDSDLRAAVQLFERAIGQHLNYAKAYAGLADCYAVLATIMAAGEPPSVAMPKAKSAARKALELDPLLADGHASLAYVHASFDWDWSSAETEYVQALRLNPSYATARQWYSEFLIVHGRLDDAIAEIKHAREYDPLSLAIPASYASAMYYARQYDETIAECLAMLALRPNTLLAYMNMGRARMMKREYPKAIAELQTAIELTGGNSTLLLALLGHAYGLARKTRDAHGIISRLTAISRLKYVPSFNFAIIYAALGDNESCFKWLRKARAERCEYLPLLTQEPAADLIRNDPRFAKVVPSLASAQASGA
jgi:TolB-like protein